MLEFFTRLGKIAYSQVQFIERYLLALSICCKAVYSLKQLSPNEINFIADSKR